MSSPSLTMPEFRATAVDTSDNTTEVNSSPCIVRGVYVNTVLSAHTVVLKDNTTAKFTLPASLAAGTWVPMGDARFDTSLVVDPDDSSTGNITVVYKQV